MTWPPSPNQPRGRGKSPKPPKDPRNPERKTMSACSWSSRSPSACSWSPRSASSASLRFRAVSSSARRAWTLCCAGLRRGCRQPQPHTNSIFCLLSLTPDATNTNGYPFDCYPFDGYSFDGYPIKPNHSNHNHSIFCLLSLTPDATNAMLFCSRFIVSIWTRRHRP